MLLLTCAPAAAAVPRIPFAHVPLSSSPLQPTAAAAAMTLLLFLPPSDEESTLAPGMPAARAPIDVQFQLLSRHGPQITARRDRPRSGSLATELQPPSATRRRPVWQFPAFRRLWLAAGAEGDGSSRAPSRQMALIAPARRSQAARRRRTAWTLFIGILRSKTQSWPEFECGNAGNGTAMCANCPSRNPSLPPWL